MPLFISEEELSRLSNDAVMVAERADAYIRETYGELEAAKTKADADAITAEQSCSLLEQKLLSISRELSDLHAENAQLQSSLDERVAELAQAQAQKHQLHLQSIGKDGEIERLTMELLEVRKSKKQFLDIIEQKDSEISDKNTAIKTYLDKIVSLTDNAAQKDARLSESEAELVRAQATCTRLSQELCSSKEVATANEERFSAELSTANKLVELYKESSEEWSRKAGELEGVIKALELRLGQVENDCKDRIEKEVSARNQLEKETAYLKEKFEKCKAETEAGRKANELNILPHGNFTMETCISPYDANDMVEDNHVLLPDIPIGVSETALAASLLGDGWSPAKLYAKYQEAVDALRHERLGRKEAESTLQRVLCELEEKAVFLMDERAEYEKMCEAYSAINKKLQNSASERSKMEKMIQELKADLMTRERDNSLAQKAISDLEKQ
ncbi:putative Nucleoprotein TPR, partial [Corchorus capsularis]